MVKNINVGYQWQTLAWDNTHNQLDETDTSEVLPFLLLTSESLLQSPPIHASSPSYKHCPINQRPLYMSLSITSESPNHTVPPGHTAPQSKSPFFKSKPQLLYTVVQQRVGGIRVMCFYGVGMPATINMATNEVLKKRAWPSKHVSCAPVNGHVSCYGTGF